MNSIVNLLERTLEELLPDNAHKRCSSRFGLTLTNLWTLEWVFISEFESRKDLLDAVICGSFIPIWSGALTFPRFRGKPYVDGGFINNFPNFELTPEEVASGRRIVGLSPFSSNVDVTPKTDKESCYSKLHVVGLTYQLSYDSLCRGMHALLPYKISNYRDYLIEGHQLMKEFVLKNHMILCKECFQKKKNKSLIDPYGNYRPSLNHSYMKHDSEESDIPKSSCLSCLKLMEKVDSLQVPQEFLDVMYEE